MAEDDRDRLVVALALDTAGRDAVAKSMKSGRWNAQLVEQFPEIIPVIARLQGRGSIGNDIEIVGHNLAKWPYYLHEIFAYRNIPDRRCCLRLADGQCIHLLLPIGKPDPLDSLSDVDLPGSNIQILPLQCTDFSDAQTAVQANQKTKIPKREILFEVIEQLSLVGCGQDWDVRVLHCRRWEVDVVDDIGPC